MQQHQAASAAGHPLLATGLELSASRTPPLGVTYALRSRLQPDTPERPDDQAGGSFVVVTWNAEIQIIDTASKRSFTYFYSNPASVFTSPALEVGAAIPMPPGTQGQIQQVRPMLACVEDSSILCCWDPTTQGSGVLDQAIRTPIRGGGIHSLLPGPRPGLVLVVLDTGRVTMCACFPDLIIDLGDPDRAEELSAYLAHASALAQGGGAAAGTGFARRRSTRKRRQSHAADDYEVVVGLQGSARHVPPPGTREVLCARAWTDVSPVDASQTQFVAVVTRQGNYGSPRAAQRAVLQWHALRLHHQPQTHADCQPWELENTLVGTHLLTDPTSLRRATAGGADTMEFIIQEADGADEDSAEGEDASMTAEPTGEASEEEDEEREGADGLAGLGGDWLVSCDVVMEQAPTAPHNPLLSRKNRQALRAAHHVGAALTYSSAQVACVWSSGELALYRWPQTVRTSHLTAVPGQAAAAAVAAQQQQSQQPADNALVQLLTSPPALTLHRQLFPGEPLAAAGHLRLHDQAVTAHFASPQYVLLSAFTQPSQESAKPQSQSQLQSQQSSGAAEQDMTVTVMVYDAVYGSLQQTTELKLHGAKTRIPARPAGLASGQASPAAGPVPTAAPGSPSLSSVSRKRMSVLSSAGGSKRVPSPDSLTLEPAASGAAGAVSASASGSAVGAGSPTASAGEAAGHARFTPRLLQLAAAPAVPANLGGGGAALGASGMLQPELVVLTLPGRLLLGHLRLRGLTLAQCIGRNASRGASGLGGQLRVAAALRIAGAGDEDEDEADDEDQGGKAGEDRLTARQRALREQQKHREAKEALARGRDHEESNDGSEDSASDQDSASDLEEDSDDEHGLSEGFPSERVLLSDRLDSAEEALLAELRGCVGRPKPFSRLVKTHVRQLLEQQQHELAAQLGIDGRSAAADGEDEEDSAAADEDAGEASRARPSKRARLDTAGRSSAEVSTGDWGQPLPKSRLPLLKLSSAFLGEALRLALGGGEAGNEVCWPAVERLVRLDLVSGRMVPDLVSRGIRARRLDVLKVIMAHVPDLSEHDLIRVVKFLLALRQDEAAAAPGGDAEDAPGSGSKKKKLSKRAAAITGAKLSDAEGLLLSVLAAPNNEVFLTQALRALMSVEESLGLLKYLGLWLEVYGSQHELYLRRSLRKHVGRQVRLPSLAQLLSWAGALVDAHLGRLMAQQRNHWCGALLRQVAKLTQEHHLRQLDGLAGMSGFLGALQQQHQQQRLLKPANRKGSAAAGHNRVKPRPAVYSVGLYDL